MGRFNRILASRLQIEVNLPNYDVRKSIIAAAKRLDRKRRNRNRAMNAAIEAQEVPDAEPVHLGSEPLETSASESHIVEIQL